MTIAKAMMNPMMPLSTIEAAFRTSHLLRNSPLHFKSRRILPGSLSQPIWRLLVLVIALNRTCPPCRSPFAAGTNPLTTPGAVEHVPAAETHAFLSLMLYSFNFRVIGHDRLYMGTRYLSGKEFRHHPRKGTMATTACEKSTLLRDIHSRSLAMAAKSLG